MKDFCTAKSRLDLFIFTDAPNWEADKVSQVHDNRSKLKESAQHAKNQNRFKFSVC